MADCRGCGQRIEWRKNTTTKTMAPINPEPEQGGTILLVGASWYRMAVTTQDWAGPLHTTHFATCANADVYGRRDPIAHREKSQ